MSEIDELRDHVLNLELVLKTMLQNSINASRRHIEKLKTVNKGNPDWNLYVAEKHKSIRECKELISRIYHE